MLANLDDTSEEVEPIDSWEEEEEVEPEVCKFLSNYLFNIFKRGILYVNMSESNQNFRLEMEVMVVELYSEIVHGVSRHCP